MNKIDLPLSTFVFGGVSAICHELAAKNWLGHAISTPGAAVLGISAYLLTYSIYNIFERKLLASQQPVVEPSLKAKIVVTLLCGVCTNLFFVPILSSAITGGAVAVVALLVSEVFKQKIKSIFLKKELYFLEEKIPVNGYITLSASEVNSIHLYQQKNHPDCIPCVYHQRFNSHWEKIEEMSHYVHRKYLYTEQPKDDDEYRIIIRFIPKDEKLKVQKKCQEIDVPSPIFLEENKEVNVAADDFPCMPFVANLWISAIAHFDFTFSKDLPILNPYHENQLLFGVDFEFQSPIENFIFMINLAVCNQDDFWDLPEGDSCKNRELEILIKLLEGELNNKHVHTKGSVFEKTFEHLFSSRTCTITPFGIRWIELYLKFVALQKPENQVEWLPVVYQGVSEFFSHSRTLNHLFGFIPSQDKGHVEALCKEFDVSPPLFLFDHKDKFTQLKTVPELPSLLVSWMQSYAPPYNGGVAKGVAALVANDPIVRRACSAEDLKKLLKHKVHVPKEFVVSMRTHLLSNVFKIRFEEAGERSFDVISQLDVKFMKEAWLPFYEELALQVGFKEDQNEMIPLMYRHKEKQRISFVLKKRKQELLELFKEFEVKPPFLLFDMKDEGILKLREQTLPKDLPEMNPYCVGLIQSYDNGGDKDYFDNRIRPFRGQILPVDDMRKLVEVAVTQKEKYRVPVCINPLFRGLHNKIIQYENFSKNLDFVLELIKEFPREAGQYSLTAFPDNKRRYTIVACLSRKITRLNFKIPKILKTLILEMVYVHDFIKDLERIKASYKG